ncbi:hypothetical protein AALP_AA7G161300 [Arabis alpina]|uniref:DUF4283 domain-containing protein n=1 Tax=Arabis alpina TaxID=50452 RepID=A0A087GIF1_ARAAL|nr:hypothetical protein AALP_AA7G161300 [Arabis alpina]
MPKKKKRLKAVLPSSSKFARISAAAMSLSKLKSKHVALSGGSSVVDLAAPSSSADSTLASGAPLLAPQAKSSTDLKVSPLLGIEPVPDLVSPSLPSTQLNACSGSPLAAVECQSSGPVSPEPQQSPKDEAPSPRKWTSVLSNSSLLEEVGTPTEHVIGVPFVLIPDENIEEAKEEFKDFIFAQFHDTPPDLGRIIGVVNALWVRTGPRIFVHKVGTSSYLLRVLNPRTRAILLSRSVWNIASHPMFVSPWSAEFNPDAPPITSAPVTVELRGVPYLLFTRKSLSRIATAVGKPVALAPETERKESFDVARLVLSKEKQISASSVEAEVEALFFLVSCKKSGRKVTKL